MKQMSHLYYTNIKDDQFEILSCVSTQKTVVLVKTVIFFQTKHDSTSLSSHFWEEGIPQRGIFQIKFMHFNAQTHFP